MKRNMYKIKEVKRSQPWIVTRRQMKKEEQIQRPKWIITRHKYRNDSFKFKIQAKRVLQFSSALLVQDEENKYALYLSSTQSTIDSPTLIFKNISEYRVFGNHHNCRDCILALKTEHYWTFLVPDTFGYLIHLPDILTGRLEKIPRLPITDSTLPAYFKKGFQDSLEFIFHANGKDYLISSLSPSFDSTEAQVQITEFEEITPLPPKCFFQAINEAGKHLYWNSILYGTYPVLEPFTEKDYPKEFKSHYGYWGKDADGNILALHITDKNGANTYTIRFHKPVKSIDFYGRTYTDTVNKYFYDIWLVTYVDGQKQMKLKTHIYSPCPDLTIDEAAWNF